MRRTQALVEGGLDLFLANGVQAVTIDDIVQRAGMAKGSFYRYFEDKEDLVRGIMSPFGDAFRRAMGRCRDGLVAATAQEELFNAYQILAAEMVAILSEQPRQALLYLQECRSPAVGARQPIRTLADELVAGAIELTGAAHSHGLLRKFPAEVSALAVMGAAERILYSYLSGSPLGDPAQVSFELISLVLHGLAEP